MSIVCVCVCVSLASAYSETINVIVINLCTVTATDLIMHHVLIILTLTFIQGRADLKIEVDHLFIDRTRSPRGFSQVQISHKLDTILRKKKYNTKHAHYTNVKRILNPKVSPFDIVVPDPEQPMVYSCA